MKRLQAEIESIDSLGLMKVRFSEHMKTNFTNSYFKLNSTFIDIFVTPVDNSNSRQLNLTWNVTSFNNSVLAVQLNFTNPLDISSTRWYDNVTFHVINFTNIFRSSNGLYLDF